MKYCISFFLLLSAFIVSAQDTTFFFTTSDSVRLHVRVAGKGRPCVFLHGGPGSTSYYFEAFAAAKILEQNMQLVYFDQRGCGRSDSAANNNYSLSRMEQDLEELRAALGHKKWSVMGHSFGGILITSYAAHYPEAVAALYMVHGTVNIQASMQSHLSFGLQQLGGAANAVYRDTTKSLQERVWAVHDELTQKDIWYQLMFRNAAEKKINDSVTMSVGRFNRDFATKVWAIPDYQQDFAPLTRNIKCPVLVITGDKDYAIGTAHFQRFVFPHQTIVHYIGGHASFQEEPQWFAEQVLRWSRQKRLL